MYSECKILQSCSMLVILFPSTHVNVADSVIVSGKTYYKAIRETIYNKSIRIIHTPHMNVKNGSGPSMLNTASCLHCMGCSHS
jgi:hypothetical protein